MRNISHLRFVILLLVLSSSGARGASLFHVDDFEDGTLQGWNGNLPTSPLVVDTGGPDGDGDHFLQVISTGFGGPGSRPATFNDGSNWIGDYLSDGVTAIELDMMNSTTTAIPLDMRLVLFGPDEGNFNRWTSTTSLSVPNDGVWRHYSYSVSAEDLTQVQGGVSYDDMISGVVQAMFRHDVGGPSARGTAAVATIGIDNITLVGDVGLLCDFDADGFCTGPDIDAMMNAVAAGMNDPSFDLNGDNIVDDLDRNEWLAEAGPQNGFAGPFLLGDANLDGGVSSLDLNALGVSWQSDNNDWTKGNFVGGGTNSVDLNELGINWQQEVPLSTAVPEPNGLAVLLTAFTVLGLLTRTKRRP